MGIGVSSNDTEEMARLWILSFDLFSDWRSHISCLLLMPQEKPWRTKTTPLPFETLNDLCNEFPTQDSRALCESKEEVYADEFFPMISLALPEGKATYEQVNEKLGEYEVDREPMVTLRDGSQYYRVVYDLRGDGVTDVTYSFSIDGKVIKIAYLLGGNDW